MVLDTGGPDMVHIVIGRNMVSLHSQARLTDILSLDRPSAGRATRLS